MVLEYFIIHQNQEKQMGANQEANGKKTAKMALEHYIFQMVQSTLVNGNIMNSMVMVRATTLMAMFMLANGSAVLNKDMEYNTMQMDK
jgi:hypothetical protein